MKNLILNHSTTLVCVTLFLGLISCTKKPTKLNNGLTKSAFDLTQIDIAVTTDSLGTENKETKIYIRKLFDDKDNVVEYFDSSALQTVRMTYDWEYDEEGLLKSLTTWLDLDSSRVETAYNYTDTFLQSITMYDETEDFITSSSTNLTYYRSGSLKTETMNYSFITKDLRDTSREQKIMFFNRSGFNYKSSNLYFDDPSKNRYYNYKKRNHMLSQIREYDLKDSLISVDDFDYELDSFLNWTIKNHYKNDKLFSISKRTINYR